MEVFLHCFYGFQKVTRQRWLYVLAWSSPDTWQVPVQALLPQRVPQVWQPLNCPSTLPATVPTCHHFSASLPWHLELWWEDTVFGALCPPSRPRRQAGPAWPANMHFLTAQHPLCQAEALLCLPNPWGVGSCDVSPLHTNSHSQHSSTSHTHRAHVKHPRPIATAGSRPTCWDCSQARPPPHWPAADPGCPQPSPRRPSSLWRCGWAWCLCRFAGSPHPRSHRSAVGMGSQSEQSWGEGQDYCSP